MEIIYLAQPALHRLGTDRLHARLQARRPPKKQRWRVANAAPKWHISSLGVHKSMDVSVQCALESGDTKQPVKQKEWYLSGAASCPPGRKRRLHRSQMFTSQKTRSFRKKKKFERFGPKHSPLHRADACRVLTAPARYRAHPAEPTERLALACKSRALLWHGRTAAASPGLPPACHGKLSLLQTAAAADTAAGGLMPAESTSPLPLPQRHEKGLGCSPATQESFARARRKAGKGLGAKDSLLPTALPPAGRLMGWGASAPINALYSW